MNERVADGAGAKKRRLEPPHSKAPASEGGRYKGKPKRKTAPLKTEGCGTRQQLKIDFAQ
ncbi:MAG TPA: hypothetical protein VGF61_15610 [Candidatus Acidoferrum sp.]